MKTAIIHDWLITYAGSERVLEQIVRLFPDADLFSLIDFLPRDQRDFIQNKPVTTSFIQKMPGARQRYRQYLPLMPLAIEQFDLSDYDLIISSSHAVAKGVLTGPSQLHISYVHTPIRYAWNLHCQYLHETGLDKGLKGLVAQYFLHRIRMWDLRCNNGVDRFVANSNFVANQIWKFYHRKAKVIYPPVDIENFSLCAVKDDFYLTASRMVPYKKMDLIVEAFSQMPQKQLLVIGDGPDEKKIRAKATSNIMFLGYQTAANLRKYMQQARAFVFAAEEDFGITPLEAQACGTPVIAYGKGGVLETIRGLEQPTPTGIFFGEQTVSSIRDAVIIFENESRRISPAACRDNAARFSRERFLDEFNSFVMNQYMRHKGKCSVNRPGFPPAG